MKALIDTTIIVASLSPDEPHHDACDRLVAASDCIVYVHALSETFSTLTGGRMTPRVEPSTAATLIEQSVLPFVAPVALATGELMRALNDAQSVGMRGGAVYDYLHLVTARKARVQRLYTLNLRHFQAFHRPGDPEVAHP